MALPSDVFTEMVTTTNRLWGKEVVDNVSGHNALVRRLKERGKIKSMSGGYEIALPISYQENSTFQRIAGYEALNVGASDVLTSAKYPVRFYGIFVTASNKELLMNSGKEQMFNLVEQRLDVAKKTATNNMSIDVYGTGALTEQINGIGTLIQTNGQGTVGGIDSATWTQWRNKFREVTGTNTAASPSVANAASFKADINALYMSCTRGTDVPDLMVLTQDFFALYEVGEQDKQRYIDRNMADAGFTNGYKYKGADVVFDSNSNFATTGETGYFLNTDYLYLYEHRDAKWTQDKPREPSNQAAVVVPIWWAGNLGCSNRALQGRLIDAA
jgi:hypothetical protein